MPTGGCEAIVGSHVTKWEVNDHGGEIGSQRFEGVASCSCEWRSSSQRMRDMERARSWARMAAATHRLLAASDE